MISNENRFLIGNLLFTLSLFSDPFSFKEVQQIKLPLPEKEMIETRDGIHLATYYFVANAQSDTLIFVHGGGAHSSSYTQLASELIKNGINVCLLDLRGHGQSEGVRGDTPTPEDVYEDLSLVISSIRKKSKGFLYLGGHSSGGGLVLNYSSYKNRKDVDGYVFLSPELGYKSDTAKLNREEFAETRLWVFILSAFTGGNLFGHTTAVYLKYPKAILETDPLLVNELSRNMAVALTPDNPRKYFIELKKPFALFVGEEDEMFDAKKLLMYAELPSHELSNKSTARVLQGKKHLSILLDSGMELANAMRKMRP